MREREGGGRDEEDEEERGGEIVSFESCQSRVLSSPE